VGYTQKSEFVCGAAPADGGFGETHSSGQFRSSLLPKGQLLESRTGVQGRERHKHIFHWRQTMRMKSILLLSALCMGLHVAPVMAQGKPLTVGTFDYPPYITAPEGAKPTGLAVDLWAEISKRSGVEVKITAEYPMQREWAMVEEGTMDGMFSIKKTPEREKIYIFPKEPLYVQDYVFFVLKESRLGYTGDLTAFADVSIGVVSKVSYGKTFDSAVEKGVLKKIDAARTYDQDFQKLLAGRVDAVVCSKLVGLSILKKLGGLDKAKVGGQPIESAVSYTVFSKKTVKQAQVDEIDKALSSMRKDGTIDRIEAKYIK
jgi:polar amino acid transport system substrate-binding protein